MPKILIEYDQDDVDSCKLQMDKEVSEGEAIVVLTHILSDLVCNPELTDMIANLLIERMYPNG